MFRRSLVLALALGLAGPAVAAAQGPGGFVEGHGAYAAFVDESFIKHAALGASARMRLGPRVAVGPEVTWMRGPGDDRDLFLTANATFDLRDSGAASTIVPYLVGGYGLLRYTDRVGTGLYTSNQQTFTIGVGTRLSPAGASWYVAPEFRFGGEGHFRIGAAFGRAWN